MKMESKDMESFCIGNIRMDGDLFLGPMAGITDMPFRILCKEQGADVVCTEMISAKGMYYKNKNTKMLLKTDKSEHPVMMQLFGSDPEIMALMAEKTRNYDYDILDINMGCPVPKVVNNGEGSALMKKPDLAAEIVERMAAVTDKPITVKFRKGFDDEHVNAVSFAKAMEKAGASAVTVHGRTRQQYYGGDADWDIIKNVKQNVKIPVIASGDIFTPEDAIRCKEYTGCDGLMVARGARGNPWIFSDIKRYKKCLEKGEKPQVEKRSIKTIADMILRHAGMLVEYKGEYIATREMRKHIAWYTAGYPNSAALRRQTNQLESMDDVRIFVEKLVTM